MESTIGRFFDGHLLEVQKIMRTVYDAAFGCGEDVEVWVDGRELVFGRNGVRKDRGFMRVVPHEAAVTLSFPKGGEVFDPKKRTKGPKGSATSTRLTSASEVDLYLRKIIDEAYVATGL